MQIGYVGVGVRRTSLFVRSPAFGPPSHCFGSVALVTRWAAEGERKDRYGSWVQRLLRIFRLSSSHLGLANVGNQSCRLNNFQKS